MMFSHPDKFLIDHLKTVADRSREIVTSKDLDIFFDMKKDDLAAVAYLIGIGHDFGKLSDSFQLHMQNVRQRKTSSADPHAPVSAFVVYSLVIHYLQTNEYADLIASIAALVVRKHHGNLDSLDAFFLQEDRKREFYKSQFNEIIGKADTKNLYEILLSEIPLDFEIIQSHTAFDDLYPLGKKVRRHLTKLPETERIKAFLLTEFLFSVLIDTDKKDAANALNEKHAKLPSPDVIDQYIKTIRDEKNGSLNILKQRFLETVSSNSRISMKKHLYSITAPTGIGKTLAGMKVALKLAYLTNIHKISYILPFTSIIDQNHGVLESVLQCDNSNGEIKVLKHHHLTEILPAQNESSSDYTIGSYSQQLLKVQSWESELVVSTYIQLLLSLIGRKNSFLCKFHNIVNSIVILDEVQFIGVKHWNLIRMVFSCMAQSFSTYFIFMTATQPKIFNKNELIELSDDSFFKDKEIDKRVSVTVIRKKMFLEDVLEILLDEISRKTKRILVILNTKKACTQIYCSLSNEKKTKGYRLFYLSTLLTPEHRKQRIEEIKRCYKKGEKYIIITTQLVEAGVDITSDVCIRDFAPFDSLVQSAGRCNRYNEISQGTFIVLDALVTEKGREYYKFIYQNSKINEVTHHLLDNSENFFSLTNLFFERIKQSESDSKSEDAVEFLNYEDLDRFKLIDDDWETFPVVVADKDAEILISELHVFSGGKNQGYDTIVQMKNIKKILMNKAVQVTQKELEILRKRGFIKESFVLYVPKDLVSSIYSPDTGFIIELDESADIT